MYKVALNHALFTRFRRRFLGRTFSGSCRSFSGGGGGSGCHWSGRCRPPRLSGARGCGRVPTGPGRGGVLMVVVTAAATADRTYKISNIVRQVE